MFSSVSQLCANSGPRCNPPRLQPSTTSLPTATVSFDGWHVLCVFQSEISVWSEGIGERGPDVGRLGALVGGVPAAGVAWLSGCVWCYSWLCALTHPRPAPPRTADRQPSWLLRTRRTVARFRLRFWRR